MPPSERTGTPLTPQELKIAILRTLLADGSSHSHKSNVLGRMFSGGSGQISSFVGALSREEFGLANRCWAQLLADGLIEPSGHDLTDPDNWCWITEVGRAALERGLSDDLDAALTSLDASLPGIREQAHQHRWAADPDPRATAGELVELLDQALRAGAPHESDRRSRARAIAEARGAAAEDLDDIAARLVLAQKKLQREKHRPASSTPAHSKDQLLMDAELALAEMLLP